MKEILKKWEVQRSIYNNLNYPHFEIKRNSSLTDKIMFHTFVEKEGRLVYCVEYYQLSSHLTKESLIQWTDRFLDKCKLTIEEGIFNKDTSIKKL